ncbi:hypothetical protein MCOR07_008210 [Pyricularia oryzae]|nr:hypothetical protein MCOR26_010811 [Pyricularia oryzae]KAI6300492.1 hypothetical protein MCOR29_010946 [Pyricularia oryzae]KAI6311524.1 hypothetical protein MCOR30_010826 [Pyricularia oryzae]KAI6353076.1 hypothetical protein MCOR32_010990 [Pyricularia oryzae]KAI6368878.1 hypothetical protein MCOR31_005365 [Pyricularia oryzae]
MQFSKWLQLALFAAFTPQALTQVLDAHNDNRALEARGIKGPGCPRLAASNPPRGDSGTNDDDPLLGPGPRSDDKRHLRARGIKGPGCPRPAASNPPRGDSGTNDDDPLLGPGPRSDDKRSHKGRNFGKTMS